MSKNMADPFHRFFYGALYYLRGIYRRVIDEDVLLWASALAFNCILCIIPLLLLIISLVGIFLSTSDIAVLRINELLRAAFPDQPYANEIKNALQSVVLDIISNRTSFGIMSVIVLIWTATFLFGASRSILNRVFRFKSTKLFFVTILENILAVIAVFVLFLVANFIFWISSLVESFVADLPELRHFDLGPLIQTFPTLITSILIFAMFYIVYQFMADRRIPPKAALIAAATTSILWILSGKVFQLYFTNFTSVSMVYGTYAFLLVFMIWVEYASLVFIIGGIVGQLYRERDTVPTEQPSRAD